MSVKNKPFVFLDGGAQAPAQIFTDPVEIISAHKLSEVDACLEQLEKHRREGAYLAGFFAYECGFAFEEKLQKFHTNQQNTPLLWFGVFPEPQILSLSDAEQWLQKSAQEEYTLSPITPTLDPQSYKKLFKQVQDYITAGDIYQANLTFIGTFEFSGAPLSLYRDLRKAQHTALGGYIETGRARYLSLSPELFFSIEEHTLRCRPMKGTAARGMTQQTDQAEKEWLARDEKSQAENLMIVDLMRNDMARIAQPGSVKVEHLYHVETYPTLHQMTSDITAKLSEDTSVYDIISTLFPCGSVTGAPKLRAMEIIHELEQAPRGIYTGAIGQFSPQGNARFNVAIRTLYIKDTSGEIGIGSGLVADSQAEQEYEECLLKMSFLTKTHPIFDLLETLKWDAKDGYVLLDAHLDRLEKSAAYFNYNFNRTKVIEDLTNLAQNFGTENQRVRLTSTKKGEINITHVPLPTQNTGQAWRFLISEKRMNSNNPFLYHKTTHRDSYDGERERLKSLTPCDEVVFLNEKGEITEGSFTNIFVRIGGKLLTPARACGLLNGTFRKHMLERENDPATEAVLYLEDVINAEEIFLGNSVRGLISAELIKNKRAA